MGFLERVNPHQSLGWTNPQPRFVGSSPPSRVNTDGFSWITLGVMKRGVLENPPHDVKVLIGKSSNYCWWIWQKHAMFDDFFGSTENSRLNRKHRRCQVLPMTDPCMPYMVTWIPSIYPSHVSIYTSTMDPSWVRMCQLIAMPTDVAMLWSFSERLFLGIFHIYTMWGPRSIAKLVNITPITMVYGTQITIVNGVYKPTYNWGAPHCMSLFLEIRCRLQCNVLGYVIFFHDISHYWWFHQNRVHL